VQAAKDLRALFLRRPTEIDECALSGGDCTLGILCVPQRYAGDHFAVCWIDDVHDLATAGFNELRINVMRRDFLNCIFVRDSVHRSSP
jgi:hypothetical protein